MSKRLTLKQELFLRKYLETGNATVAAIEAYNPKKRNVAAQIGYENLRKPYISEAIHRYFERMERIPVSTSETFVDILKNGTPAQQLKATLAYFKIMGLT